MLAAELATLIPECCSEVLEAMYFTAVLGSSSGASAPEASLETTDASSDLAFSLHFAGDVSGRFGLRLHLDTARSFAANFLGEDVSEISPEDANEVAGELANMFCGSVMSRVEGDHKFVLSHPEAGPFVSYGTDDLLVSTLQTDSGEVTVWVTIEGNP